MAKLHIYKKAATWTNIADGDGTIDKKAAFAVKLTKNASSVHSGNTYQIREGQAATGTLCDCTAVNGSNATFKVSAHQLAEVEE